MPKYIAKAYLVKNGKVIQTDNEVELTEEEAKRLGDKVEAVDPKENDGEGAAGNGKGEDMYTEASIKKLSADEQKAIVEQLEGDLSELTNEEKRINFILENQ
ncbi:hypothetical protein GMD78_12285 [Ornithinibacillus sp. L9]|uniref:YqbF C-terminal domain-containing protein n=1 Tax=Ornithinibacillus caprae TaxID=2678566 RepID=A0A6N8FIT8_9BACI|nr:hypothetical protein [Ornithinibacillus caprae]MUK89151.1 hypothetical protein [Ornithinibacillus caprae]